MCSRETVRMAAAGREPSSITEAPNSLQKTPGTRKRSPAVSADRRLYRFAPYFPPSTKLTRSAAGIGIDSTSDVVIVPKLPILSMTASSSALDRVSTWRT